MAFFTVSGVFSSCHDITGGLSSVSAFASTGPLGIVLSGEAYGHGVIHVYVLE
jgi:hypothetical protein